MTKTAPTDYPILDHIRNRWSPRSFANTSVDDEQLFSLFEAARWAPSGGNHQPWFFIVTRQGTEAYEKLYSTLKDTNLRWANTAPILVLTVMNPKRENGSRSYVAAYDLGQAVSNLSIQATAQGLHTHQMGGFWRDKAAALFELPDDYEVMTVIAIGYLGKPEALPEDLMNRESNPRTRKPLSEFVFNGKWGSSLTE